MIFITLSSAMLTLTKPQETSQFTSKPSTCLSTQDTCRKFKRLQDHD